MLQRLSGEPRVFPSSFSSVPRKATSGFRAWLNSTVTPSPAISPFVLGEGEKGQGLCSLDWSLIPDPSATDNAPTRARIIVQYLFQFWEGPRVFSNCKIFCLFTVWLGYKIATESNSLCKFFFFLILSYFLRHGITLNFLLAQKALQSCLGLQSKRATSQEPPSWQACFNLWSVWHCRGSSAGKRACYGSVGTRAGNPNTSKKAVTPTFWGLCKPADTCILSPSLTQTPEK